MARLTDEHLFRLVDCGNFDGLSRALQENPVRYKPFVKKRDREGAPFLHACSRGHVQILEVLLAFAGLPTWHTPFPSSNECIVAAAKNGHLPLVNYLISRGLAGHENASLCCACKGGHLRVAQRLLDAGADPNRVFGGKSPLQHALLAKHDAIVRLLLQYEIDLDSPSQAPVKSSKQLSTSPLEIAWSQSNLGMMKELITAGADAKVASSITGKTALHFAVCCDHLDAFSVAETLLTYGAYADAQDEKGCTPLYDCMVSCLTGAKKLDIFELLVAHGADAHKPVCPAVAVPRQFSPELVGNAFSSGRMATLNMESLNSYAEEIAAAAVKVGGSKAQKPVSKLETVSKRSASQPES